MKLGDNPAYPVPPDTEYCAASNGMTLRQHYAGLAMQGILAVGGPNGHIDGQGDDKDIAQRSIILADALLAALEKQP